MASHIFTTTHPFDIYNNITRSAKKCLLKLDGSIQGKNLQPFDSTTHLSKLQFYYSNFQFVCFKSVDDTLISEFEIIACFNKLKF